MVECEKSPTGKHSFAPASDPESDVGLPRYRPPRHSWDKGGSYRCIHCGKKKTL